ncbi:hypothetical protein [Bernardetia sp.]|uniref:hypothetical protein n=1 Tax=Bernardetia sp. TaxID=1937974 RepID=UPI0025C0B15C|nr:hypothetical protein [Bernardetia sp.]
MNKRACEKSIFRTLHLILETQKMIELYEEDSEFETDLSAIREHKEMLTSLIRDINDDLLPYNLGLYSLSLDNDAKQNRY